MLPSILPVALLALRGASFILAGPDNDENEFVFYIGDYKDAAQDWANERLDIPTITLWDTDRQLADDTTPWFDEIAARTLWVKQYTKLARGTAWFYWKDADKVPPGTGSWYFDLEEPIQIMPVDLRDYKGKQCAWHGEAPKCEHAKCPDGTKKITESKYGDNPNERCEGDDRKVFCCKE
ncbi:uncharacterized protein BKCO1_6400041 [Diplodia corticola]|uniref:Uncharacterized protein n=1 Tax=Diplodia corticola TaxID=236234 RepID=A0A1J9RRQ5_9PEZI|nr:uncharacterized protein BKCO1_6400041 [Diplodia corticola]OJD30213.1 hypothetical protein BKCO1_6400041 [Diplodia corticola]